MPGRWRGRGGFNVRRNCRIRRQFRFFFLGRIPTLARARQEASIPGAAGTKPAKVGSLNFSSKTGQHILHIRSSTVWPKQTRSIAPARSTFERLRIPGGTKFRRRAPDTLCSLCGVSQMVFHRETPTCPAFDPVLQRIQSRKRCVQASGCKIEFGSRCISSKLEQRKKRKQARRADFGPENGFGALQTPGAGFGGKRANLEAQAAQKTQDTKNFESSPFLLTLPGFLADVARTEYI